MTLNNIDTRQVKDYREEIRKNPQEATFTARIEGDWLFEEGGPQFRSTVKVKDGSYTMEASHPNFAGPGVRPGPMAFGLFWFAACYSSTFMTDAAVQGIKIDHLKTRVEADLNYLAQFDLASDPLVGEYRIFVEVKSSAPEKKIVEIKDHALKTCMGMYTSSKIVPCGMPVSNSRRTA